MTIEEQLKNLVVSELRLHHISADEISDDMPLFGEGLGLDSLDAVEIVVLLDRHFKIDTTELENSKQAFRSIKTLADFVRKKQEQQ
jgi:acyl carrier protein